MRFTEEQSPDKSTNSKRRRKRTPEGLSSPSEMDDYYDDEDEGSDGDALIDQNLQEKLDRIK